MSLAHTLVPVRLPARSFCLLARPRARFDSSLARMLRWLCVTVGMLTLSSAASAQPMGEVVVVPFGVPQLAGPLNVTSLLEAELANERVSLIPMHDARDRFTAHSRPPLTASDSDLDVLARAAREAIEHVAFGRTAAAQKSVREVILRAEKTLESLNRETATARHILDACLSLVRTALQTGRRDLAIEQATRCRRLVPDLVPSETNHPANVVGVLAEADNMLRRMHIGHLAVRSAPESNCSVYLNGRHLGTTPFQLERAAAGDYRVQVECGRTVGRVHVVQLGDQAVSLLVDTEFDRAVASDPRLALSYPNRDRLRELAVPHAIELGRAVQADDVVLVGVHNERAELLRVQVAQRKLVARASVPWTPRHGFSRPLLEAAIAALAEGRFDGEPSVERTETATPPPEDKPVAQVSPTLPLAALPPPVAAPPVQVAPVVEVPDPPALSAGERQRLRERRVRRAGLGLLGVSGALFVAGIAYEWRAQRLLDRLARLGVSNDVAQRDPSSDAALTDATSQQLAQQQPKYDTASHLRWIGVAGGALATGATAMLVRPHSKMPRWSYSFFGIGLAIAGFGAYEIASSDTCQLSSMNGPCRRPRDTAARGALLLSAAAPFLSVPLIHLLKPRPSSLADASDASRGRNVALSAGPTYGGLQLQLRASY